MKTELKNIITCFSSSTVVVKIIILKYIRKLLFFIIIYTDAMYIYIILFSYIIYR